MRTLPLLLLCLLLSVPAPARARARPRTAPADTARVAPAAPAATVPDGMALLERVSSAYRGLSTYWYRGMVSIAVSGNGPAQSLETQVDLAGDRQGRMRMDLRNPSGGLLISDGRKLTTYAYSLQQYTEQDVPPHPDSAGLAIPPQNSPLARYFGGGLQGLRSATVSGPALLDLDGSSLECWVVRAETQPPPQDSTATLTTTIWVDRARSIVLRDSTSLSMANPQTGGRTAMTQVARYDQVLIDAPVPDTLFAFTPPPGAKKVTAFGQAETESPLIGKPAPPFTLKGVKGSTVSLASYKGKVVLLDFWATWCGPCRKEMPEIEAIYKELKPRGLVVFGVNQGEDAETVRKFLAATPYSFPILLDQKIEAGAKYEASAIPTMVIIGKDGKVSTYFRGMRDGATIREALAKAGMK